jgi:hypothetical protein
MTVVHEPSLQLLQFATHLTPLLGPAFSDLPFFFGEFAMYRPGGCKPRQTFFCAWAGRCTPVQPAPPYRQLCGPLTGCALTRLGTAPFTGPFGAKAPFITRLEPTFCHLKNHRIYEVLQYHIFGRIARCGLLGSRAVSREPLGLGPRPEQNHPIPTELRKHYVQNVGGCSIVRGPWCLVHGPWA